MRRALLILACLALAPAPRTAAEDAPPFVDLTGATVLASAGAPEGLHPFLPGGRAPKPLAWPLPGGPVLVLGLPQTDPAARDLAFFWDLLAPGEDLHGGYLVAAWHDGTRPIAVILGDDAAALYAARFELESMPAPRGMATLDFTRPPMESGLRVRRGRRAFRPRFRIRAYAPCRVSPDSVLTAIAGHANRFWFPFRDVDEAPRALARLIRHGVVPCVVLTVWVDDTPEILARRATHWFRLGVRHVVLRAQDGRLASGVAAQHLRHLRARWDLDEVVIHDDRTRLPGAYGTWDPQTWCGDPIPERVLREHAPTEPVLFVDRWALRSRTPVPGRPRGRPPALPRLVDGVVVLDGPGAREVLEDAWARSPEIPEEWESVLLPLLPRTDLEPRAFLQRAAVRLEALDAPSRQAVAWLDPLRETIRTSLGELAERVVTVPRVPARTFADGALNEPLWGHAVALAFPLPGDPPSRSGTLLAAADGRDLHVALRLPADLPLADLYLTPLATEMLCVAGIGDAASSDAGSWRRTQGVRTWEGTLGYWDLSGDAHPTRVLHLWLRPRDGAPQRLASLVLGP